MPEEESGLDELMRLSRQFNRQAEEDEARERQRQAQGKKVRGVLQGLKDLNIAMALSQLEGIADPAIIKRVGSLKGVNNPEDLRKLVSSLSDSIERKLGTAAARSPEYASLTDAMRTLNILLDLYFSLQ